MSNSHERLKVAAELSRNSTQILGDLREHILSQARGMWRYRWPAVALMWVFSIVGWIGVYSLAPVYRAEARILIDTENAIQPLLKGIATSSDVMDEVRVVIREMLSRPNLAEVAHANDLNANFKTDAQFERLLGDLQQRIQVKTVRENIFSVTFSDPDRMKAIGVVDSIVNRFVEQTITGDRQETTNAQAFLREQIAEYEARLTESEDKLAKFKRDNVAMMPDQRGDYYARLQLAEAARDSTRGRLRMAEDRRAELMRQLEGEEPVFGIMPGTEAGTGGGGFAASKIIELESQLAELRLQYTDKHPRIGQILDTIELLEQQQEEEREAAAAQGASNSLAIANPLDINPVYQNMRIQLSNIEVEIASLRSELVQQQDAAEQQKLLVDTVPQVEANLGRLNRDYLTVKRKYEQLLAQLEKANLGEHVNASIDDARIRIIDPPFADRKPAGPKRQLLIGAILFGAFGLGGGVAFILNLLHPVLFSGRELTLATGLPILGMVSLLVSPDEARARRNDRLRFSAVVIFLMVSFTIVGGFADTLSPVVRSITGTAL